MNVSDYSGSDSTRFGRQGRPFYRLLGFLLLNLLLASPAEAQYLGEVTWTATITETESGLLDPPVNLSVQAGLTRVGGRYFSLHGCLNSTESLIISGNGVLVGEIIKITGSLSLLPAGSSGRITGILQAEINRISLNGSFSMNLLVFDSSGVSFSSHYATGTLTRSSGP